MDVQIARSCLRLGTHGVNIQLPGTVVARRSVASQLFTGFSSMHGGSLRGARDPRGSIRHTLLKILKFRAETTRQGLHTRPQPNSIKIGVNSKLSRQVPDSRQAGNKILLQLTVFERSEIK